MVEKKVKDIVNTECAEDSVVKITDSLGDEQIVCPENRAWGLETLEILDKGLSVLDDVPTLEKLIAVLDDKELDRIYNHPVTKEYDLMP
jgi:hypothetical protein